MGLLSVLAAGAAAIVAAAAVSFLCDELSEYEVRRQQQMQREYAEYEQGRYAEYRQTCTYYEQLRTDRQNEYEQEIRRYHLELIQKRKKENKKFYDNRLTLLNEQRKEKEKLFKDCSQIIETCKKNIRQQQNTYLRFKSIKTTVISLEESMYKLKAYLEYLDGYKQKLDIEYENSGELIEPFSLTLPKGYPYEGELLLLDPDHFVNGADCPKTRYNMTE